MNFPQYDHHICLVSEQTLPNYLGAVVPGAAPQNVHLVVTDRMKERAGILEKALRLRGYAVTQHTLASQEANDMIEVLDDIYEKTGSSVAINVTGGTKIMALNTVEWAGIQDNRPFLFYVDTDTKRILQIGGQGRQYEMTTALKLEELIRAGTGADISLQKNSCLEMKQRDILERLIQLFLKNGKALEMFNKYSKEAEYSLDTAMPSSCPQEFKQAVALAQEAGKLHIYSGKIKYESENARFWCNGGWLEEFVQSRLYRMKSLGLIEDWACNIEIFKKQKSSTWKDNKKLPNPQNEIDAAFTAENRLFVIECKTANLAKRNGFPPAIYKLDSLKKNIGGVFSRGMIVSVHKPRPEDVQRCEDLHIELLYGKDVPHLEEKLKNWIQNAHR